MFASFEKYFAMVFIMSLEAFVNVRANRLSNAKRIPRVRRVMLAAPIARAGLYSLKILLLTLSTQDFKRDVFLDRTMFKGKKCNSCEGKIKDSFDFCPYCGFDLKDPEADAEDFGMLGKNNHIQGYPLIGGLGSFGITDRMISSIFKSLMKSFEGQMKNVKDNPHEIESFPNGIRIKIGTPGAETIRKTKKVRKSITPEQVDKMSKLPRAEAKTNIRRLNDKVVYELSASGVESPDDVFISKLENGYEIKAIGKRKVYVNSIPVNLPLKSIKLDSKILKVEFSLE